MNKKLMAAAVAAALAAPGVALAQASSVTISGIFKVGVENLSYSNSPTARLNTSQMRVVDNSSRIIFTSVEALGNGLSAVGNLDIRFAPDNYQAMPTANKIGEGNTYVGLRSTSWGMLSVGRWDLHYGKGPSEMTRGAGALQASDVSLFDFINGSPIANASRTQNVVKYDTVNMSGFSATVAWSANPGGNSDLDMLAIPAVGSFSTVVPGAIPGTVGFAAASVPNTAAGTPGGANTTRKGDGWNINPRYSNGPFEAEYSYWRAKPDAPVATTNDQRGDSLTGKYSFGGFKVGIGWNRSKLENSNTGLKAAERTTWSVAGHYKTGPHSIYAHYDKAGNNSNSAGTVSDSGARMLALAYEYSLSKRTSVAATYAKINNDAAASYNFFTSAALGSSDATPVAGESPRLFQLSVLHLY